MNETLRELLLDELSDEAAYQLVDFFYNLALAFESIHLGKVMRHSQSLNDVSSTSLQPWDKELTDPPF